MKIAVLFGFLISVTVLSHAQSERKKKVSHSHFFSRAYHFLKENPSVKDGPYELSFQGTTVIKGQYEKSKKIGIWTFWNSLGEELYQYDFSADSLVKWTNAKFDAIKWESASSRQILQDFNSASLAPYIDFYAREFTVIKGTDTIQSKLDRPPLLLDSFLKFQLELFDILRTNVSSFRVNSRSLISFTVDSSGNTKNFRTLAGSGLGFEGKFLEKLKAKNLKWIPGKLGAKYVDTEITIPIIIDTDYRDPGYIRSNIVFTDLSFISHFRRLTFNKDFKNLDSWKYVIFD